jgi:hypothetical protein
MVPTLLWSARSPMARRRSEEKEVQKACALKQSAGDVSEMSEIFVNQLNWSRNRAL